MEYQIADIVRFKDKDKNGLYEITGCIDKDGYYTVTNDECDSEYYANHNDLIFVCARKDRKDL